MWTSHTENLPPQILSVVEVVVVVMEKLVGSATSHFGESRALRHVARVISSCVDARLACLVLVAAAAAVAEEVVVATRSN